MLRKTEVFFAYEGNHLSVLISDKRGAKLEQYGGIQSLMSQLRAQNKHAQLKSLMVVRVIRFHPAGMQLRDPSGLTKTNSHTFPCAIFRRVTV